MSRQYTPGPWKWQIHDFSMASLVGPDEMEDHVLSISPCSSCQEYNKEKIWKWGACTTVNEADAELVAAAPELLNELIDLVDTLESVMGCSFWEGSQKENDEILRPARELIVRLTKSKL